MFCREFKITKNVKNLVGKKKMCIKLWYLNYIIFYCCNYEFLNIDWNDNYQFIMNNQPDWSYWLTKSGWMINGIEIFNSYFFM